VLFKPVPLLGPPRISTSLAVPAAHHNYSLGGEMVNAFALGPVGAEDDLWLVAAEPPAEGEGACTALITANILDAFGRRLAAVSGNRLTFGAKSAEIVPTAQGWRLVAGGQAVLEVETRLARAAGCAISYLHGLLRDKRGAVRLETRGGRDSPSLVIHGRFAYGFRPDGTFGQNHGLTDEEIGRAGALMRAGGGTQA
jgi:hypothetical protein